MILLAILLLLAVLLVAFFAGMETACISANRVRLTTTARAGDGRARVALKLLATPDRLITTCLVGTNIGVVGASFIATALVVQILPADARGWAVPVTSLLLTPLLLVLGDLLPKAVGRAFAEELTLAAAYPLSVLDWVLTPISIVALGLSRLLLRLRGIKPGTQQRITREELRVMMHQGARGEAIDDRTARMVGSAFSFSSREVREVMTPLREVRALPEEAAVPEAFASAVESGSAFIVVYRERVDAIVGVVPVMELVRAPLQATLDRIMTEPLFVPESQNLRRMLETFRRRQVNLAVVVDEYGSTLGVVTLDDVVGTITEATQEGLAAAGPLDRGESVVLPADLALTELADRYEVALPEGDYATLGGFLIDRLEHIPRAGEEVVHEGYAVRVLDATPRRVVSVVVERRH
jgi:putative hemolysin